jgi:hypothetical protein
VCVCVWFELLKENKMVRQVRHWKVVYIQYISTYLHTHASTYICTLILAMKVPSDKLECTIFLKRKISLCTCGDVLTYIFQILNVMKSSQTVHTYVGTYNEIFPALCFFTVKQATSRIRRLDGAGQLMTWDERSLTTVAATRGFASTAFWRENSFLTQNSI